MKQPPSRIAGKVCVGNLGGNHNTDKKILQATRRKVTNVNFYSTRSIFCKRVYSLEKVWQYITDARAWKNFYLKIITNGHTEKLEKNPKKTQISKIHYIAPRDF